MERAYTLWFKFWPCPLISCVTLGSSLIMDAHGRVEPDSRDEPLSCGPAQGWPESREGEAVPPAGGTPGIPSGLFRMEGKEV